MDVPQAGDGTSETTRRRAPGRRRSTTTTQVEDGGAAPPTNAPCGACKFLRRKCISGCIFAPHFGSDQGAARFAAVHKVFGASNVSKLLMHIPVNRRHDAVVTISYEAQARLSDPVYGCVSTIIALQQQVASLQAEVSVVQTQLINSRFVLANTLQMNSSSSQQQQQQEQQQLSSASNNNNNNNNLIISNMQHHCNFSPNFAETAPSFEPVNLHLSGRALQDEEEEQSHDPVAFAANHIFR